MKPWQHFSEDEMEEGFTLIELIVVIIIIGILAAIAIPAFLNQRKSAVDASVQSDLRNSGSLMLIESLEGKTLTRTVSINKDGVIGFATARARTSTSTEFDFSSIRVSEGNTLIFQPSMIDGGVCIFGVNPAGDVAAKAPGYTFDSNEGGMLSRGATPGACASETGELNVPVTQIEHALDPDKPVASEPPPTIPEPAPTPTPTPTPEPAVPMKQTLTEKLTDRDKKCLAGNLTVSLSYTAVDGMLGWSATGLSTLKLDAGTIYLYEVDANGDYVWTHIIDVTTNMIKSDKYEGSLNIGEMDSGNRLILADDENSMFFAGYKKYYVSDKDWDYNTITKNCV